MGEEIESETQEMVDTLTVPKLEEVVKKEGKHSGFSKKIANNCHLTNKIKNGIALCFKVVLLLIKIYIDFNTFFSRERKFFENLFF